MRLLQLAWGVESLAVWTFAIALGVYAFDVSGPTAVGIAALVRLLPGAFAAPFGGLTGDRYSRRAVLVGSAGANALLLAGGGGGVAAGAPPAVVFCLAGVAPVSVPPLF